MNLAHVQAFAEVVKHGSFSAAARRMGTPTSSISRAVARLERDLSGKLFERTTRKIALTPLGQAFHEHAVRALSELREGEQRAHEIARDPRGEVGISIPTDLDGGFFARAIARFAIDHPKIRVACSVDNRYVDLIEAGFDLALRVADDLPDSSSVGRPLGRYRAWLVASREYLSRRGTPRSVADLRRHDCVMNHAREGVGQWRLLGPDALETVTLEARVVASDMRVTRALIRAGAGIGIVALAPPEHTPPHEGELVRVLPRYEVVAPRLYLIAPSVRRVPARVAMVREHLLRAYGASP